jgi:hypothetical protein
MQNITKKLRLSTKAWLSPKKPRLSAQSLSLQYQMKITLVNFVIPVV